MTVIVTGASSGIGRAIAERLYSKGHEVIGISKYSVEDDRYPAPDFQLEQADVTNIDDLKAVYDKIKNKKVTGLVNAAGYFASYPMNYFKYEEYKKVIDINLIGIINSCSVFIGLMDRKVHTPIINISSAASLTPNVSTVYTASKAGVNAFTLSLAKELSNTKIRPNAICPGLIETDMTRVTALDKKTWITMVEKQPIGIQLVPDDVADIVELLFDEKSSSIGGQSIQIG